MGKHALWMASFQCLAEAWKTGNSFIALIV